MADYPSARNAPVPSQLAASDRKVWWTNYQSSPFSLDLVSLDLEGDRITSVRFSLGLTNLVPSGDVAFFTLGGEQSALWVSDGTSGGTIAVSNLVAPQGLSDVSGMSASPRGVYFVANDVLHGSEVWESDGSPEGTRRVSDFGYAEALGGLEPSQIALVAGGYVFPATDGIGGRGLWVSAADRTPELLAELGVYYRRVAYGSAADRRVRLLPVPERVGVFCGDSHRHDPETYTIDGIGYLATERLWRTDGTEEGTFLLFVPGGRGYIQRLSNGVRLRFVVDDEGFLSLWEATGDGTSVQGPIGLPVGIRLVSSALSVPSGMFFMAADGHLNEELWYFDASSGSFEKLIDAGESKISLSSRILPLGSEVVLPFVREGSRSGGLIRSNGTTDGTEFVDVPMKAGWTVRAAPFDLMVHDETAYFVMLAASPGVLQREVTVWRLGEGSNEADSILSFPLREEAWPSFEDFPTIQLTGVDTSVYYISDRPEEGVELWISDGTSATERLVKDIQPGLNSSRPRELTAAGSVLYFSAYHSTVGRELWRSDGTKAGTRLVHDLSPGGPSSDPQELEAAGDHLYFSADDDLLGRHLWALPLEASGGCASDSSPHVLCLREDRFQVEMIWRDFAGLAGRANAIDLSADTGAFWFFDSANVESIVKVLDGRALNEHTWVYSGSLSNVEHYTTVTDSETGTAVRYFNPMGTFASFGDVEAFGPRGAKLRSGVSSPPAAGRSNRGEVVRAAPPAPRAPAPCVATTTRLCLAGGRFAVEVAWSTGPEDGSGQAVSWTADTGSFWFFDPANTELIVKVLDGTAINGRYWVFYGSLSDVAYTIRVTDGATGAVREYHNPRGEFASVGDTDAF